MTKKVLNALKGSIKKWEKIVAGKGVDEGSSNCPLCRLYGDWECKGCPVFEKTNKKDCENTPYYKWMLHQSKMHDAWLLVETLEIQCKICERFAKQELEFLKSLLPKEKTNDKKKSQTMD
jgi:hypothetical protein